MGRQLSGAGLLCSFDCGTHILRPMLSCKVKLLSSCCFKFFFLHVFLFELHRLRAYGIFHFQLTCCLGNLVAQKDHVGVDRLWVAFRCDELLKDLAIFSLDYVKVVFFDLNGILLFVQR